MKVKDAEPTLRALGFVRFHGAIYWELTFMNRLDILDEEIEAQEDVTELLRLIESRTQDFLKSREGRIQDFSSDVKRLIFERAVDEAVAPHLTKHQSILEKIKNYKGGAVKGSVIDEPIEYNPKKRGNLGETRKEGKHVFMEVLCLDHKNKGLCYLVERKDFVVQGILNGSLADLDTDKYFVGGFLEDVEPGVQSMVVCGPLVAADNGSEAMTAFLDSGPSLGS